MTETTVNNDSVPVDHAPVVEPEQPAKKKRVSYKTAYNNHDKKTLRTYVTKEMIETLSDVTIKELFEKRKRYYVKGFGLSLNPTVDDIRKALLSALQFKNMEKRHIWEMAQKAPGREYANHGVPTGTKPVLAREVMRVWSRAPPPRRPGTSITYAPASSSASVSSASASSASAPAPVPNEKILLKVEWVGDNGNVAGPKKFSMRPTTMWWMFQAHANRSIGKQLVLYKLERTDEDSHLGARLDPDKTVSDLGLVNGGTVVAMQPGLSEEEAAAAWTAATREAAERRAIAERAGAQRLKEYEAVCNMVRDSDWFKKDPRTHDFMNGTEVLMFGKRHYADELKAIVTQVLNTAAPESAL